MEAKDENTRRKLILKNWKKEAVLLFYAFALMLLCAGSSPLIQYLSPDSSIFYTMGRSAAHGTVLYQEIADHKGFYLFLFNWIGAWLTPNSMNGLFLVEIVFAYIKMRYVYKIAGLFCGSEKKCIVAAACFMALATNFLSWNTGNLGEAFVMTFQIISLYYMAKYCVCIEKSGDTDHKPGWMFIHGMCSGIALFIQANFICMWIPFGIGLAVYLLGHKKIRNFIHNLLALLAGVIVTIIPVFLYGLIHKCLEDMWYVMFEINFLYSHDGRIGKSLLGYLKDFVFCPSFLIVVIAILGCVVVWKRCKKSVVKWTFLTMLICSIICMSVSLNANPIYYSLYIPFTIPFFIWLVQRLNIFEKYMLPAVLGILMVSVLFNMQLAKKILRIGTSSYVYEGAGEMEKLIANKEDKVLVLGNSCYYNITGTLPHIRYFTIFGSGLKYETFPYCVDEQFESLLSGENDYIIIQYNDSDGNFWMDAGRDEQMKEYLSNKYMCAYDYQEGGIHSALWKRNVE